MKKEFISEFQPARLIKAAYRWYISFYIFDTEGRINKRYRPTFDLNRIKDLKLRERRGEVLVDKINYWLENGFPIHEFQESKVTSTMLGKKEVANTLPHTDALEAMEKAIALKTISDRDESNLTYKSKGKLFIRFLMKMKWDKMAIGQFGQRHAMAYLDYRLIKQKVSPVTYNNDLTHLSIFFTELKKRGYVEENPFKDFKKKPIKKKKRRNFTQKEAALIIDRVHKENRLLFYAILFQYCGFMRPSEIRQLTFEDVDLDNGVVFVGGDVAKNKKDRHVTIPDSFIPHFDREFFDKWPDTYYIFGADFRPHPDRLCYRNKMYKTHRSILKKLKKEGRLKSIEGLQFYGWKDTGITDALEDINLVSVQDQAGHHSPDMTLKYRHKNKVNEKMKGFKNKIMR